MNKPATIWIVLGLLVLGLLLVLVFTRPADVDQAAVETGTVATTTAEAFDRTTVRATAAAELTALRARAEAGETYDELASDFADVRARVAASYDNAEGAAAEEWQDIRAGFDSFEASARAGTGDFLDSFTDLINRFSADIRVETEAE